MLLEGAVDVHSHGGQRIHHIEWTLSSLSQNSSKRGIHCQRTSSYAIACNLPAGRQVAKIS